MLLGWSPGRDVNLSKLSLILEESSGWSSVQTNKQKSGRLEGGWGREVEGEVTTLFWIQIQGKLKVQSEYR